MKNLTVYLDSNLAFSILGFHEEEYEKPALELFSLLNRFKIGIKILCSTVDKMTQILKK